MATAIASSYNSSKNYSDNIIGNVTDSLDKGKISYSVKSSKTEVIIPIKNQSTDSIYSTLYSNLSVPKVAFLLLVDIIECNDTIYIRQKTK